jgi:endonuclease/exonuclease/phosphatase (EEP) superfamily protein YafD
MYRKYLPWHLAKKEPIMIKNNTNDRLQDAYITLLNWNVHKNNHHYKWLRDFSDILELYHPNLISFQEYQKMSRRSILDHHDDFAYGFFPNIAYKQHMYGLLSAGKSKIYESEAYLSSDVEPLFKTPKVSLKSTHHLSHGKVVTLINVHMINFVKIKKYIAQIAQIERLCGQHEGAMILTGDFNTWSEKRMRILTAMTDGVGLKRVEFSPEYHKKALVSNPLDHIFYRGLKVGESRILKDIKSSDHKPMLVRFEQLS